MSRSIGRGALRSAVRRLVLSPEAFGWQRNLERGRLDPRALHRAKMGARDVYRRPDLQEGHKAAVSLVLDMSGSMGGDAVPQAIMAYQVAAAVEAAGALVSVSAFTGGETLARVKGFGERVAAMQERFLAAGHSPGSFTPLAPAIVATAAELVQAPATARVLFALTDGQDDSGPHRVREAIKIAQAQGVAVVGVLIQKSDRRGPEAFGFDQADAAVATPAANLGPSVLSALAALLDRNRGKRKVA